MSALLPNRPAPNSGLARATGSDILIAEDNRIVSRVIGKILEKEGHQIHYVTDGPAALDVLLNRRLDLALLSASLPGMNPVEVTSLYRFGSKGRQHLPILGMIGEMSAPMLSAWLEAGLDGCIGKPVEPNELIEAVNSCLPGAAAHPLLSTARPSLVEVTQNPTIDCRVLGDLEKLGGPGFVDEIIAQFATDTSRLLPELSASAAAGDAALFHDQLHALRSCAGNVGAVGLFKLCLASHATPVRHLVNENCDYVAQLASEFERAIAALNQHEWRRAAPLFQQAS